MAVEALKKLEEVLNCSICLGTYTDPKQLQCNHVYCRQCLVPLVVRDQQGQLGLTCPTCRRVTPIADRGVAGLQSAFHINPFLEVQASFQKLEDPAATLREVLGGATTKTHCLKHPEEELKLYCETCEELVCLLCIMKEGNHHDHDCAVLKKAFEGYKKEMQSAFEPMVKRVKTLEISLAQLDKRCGEISDQKAAIRDGIHVTFRRLREVLDTREAELTGQLDQIAESKLKGLAAQRDQIETTLSIVNRCLNAVNESIIGNELDVLMNKTWTVKEVKEVTAPLQSDTLIPNASADIEFSTLEGITAVCRNYGEILALGLPDPSKCHSTCKGTEVVVGEKSMAVLHAINFEGKPCKELIKSLQCELVSEITGTRTICSVERRGQSQYEISYQLTIKGRHQLHIKAEGKHVKRSPYCVTAKSPVKKLGTPILAISGVDGPWGIAINQRSEVVVTEGDRHCISVFSPSGEKLLSFGKFGSGWGEFLGPYGVAVNAWGNILVADSTNHRIQKFSAEGQFLAGVGTKGSGALQFSYPTDIACSGTMVYVVDNDNHRVQVLNSDLTYSGTIGKKGSGKSNFNEPWGVACDSTGKVYVADRVNHRIQVFTAEGKFLTMFGKRGQGRGELDGPHYLAIDSSGLVYVSERNNHRITVFTSEGQYVTSFGSKGPAPGEFSLPHGVAVDGNGVVCVCDCVNKRLILL